MKPDIFVVSRIKYPDVIIAIHTLHKAGFIQIKEIQQKKLMGVRSHSPNHYFLIHVCYNILRYSNINMAGIRVNLV
jgi:hypothetical protein